MKKVQEPTVRKTLTMATSRIHRQPLVGLLAGIVVMSVVVLSGEELKHVPPAAPSYIVLYGFTRPPDGANPDGALIRDTAGNLYGTTFDGGTENGECENIYCGVVFELSPTGTETVLYRFNGADGANPSSGVIRDSAGNLYGTTAFGGASRVGVVFKVSPSGTETVLHSFTFGDGSGPNAWSGTWRVTFTAAPGPAAPTRVAWCSSWALPVPTRYSTASLGEGTEQHPTPVWSGTRPATCTAPRAAAALPTGAWCSS